MILWRQVTPRARDVFKGRVGGKPDSYHSVVEDEPQPTISRVSDVIGLHVVLRDLAKHLRKSRSETLPTMVAANAFRKNSGL